MRLWPAFDRQTVSDSFLTAGQSFEWTEYAATDTNGDARSVPSDGAIPADGGAATCQLVTWYTGS